MLSLLLILFVAHLVKILMLLRPLADDMLEFAKWTARTGASLAVGDRAGCCVRDEADELAGTITRDGAALAGHLLHAYVTKERD